MLFFFFSGSTPRLPLVHMHGNHPFLLHQDGNDHIQWRKTYARKENTIYTHTNMISTVGEAECLHDDVQCLPRSMEVFSMIDSDACLSQRLPPVGATAGKVLEHGARVFAKLQEQHSPMTFKFGITHNPHYRWNNTTFGYKWCVDKFQHMIILFAAGNPYAPAFLEASLIREFGSAMAFFSKMLVLRKLTW